MTTLLKLLAAFILFTMAGCQKLTEAPAFSVEEDTEKVKAILKIIDRDVSDTSIYTNDVVHMAQGRRAITDKAELGKVLSQEASGGKTVMKHELITIHSYHDIVLTRGRVKGWYPGEGGKQIPFETNNMLVFRRMHDGTLKVWQVIFNRVNLDDY